MGDSGFLASETHRCFELRVPSLTPDTPKHNREPVSRMQESDSHFAKRFPSNCKMLSFFFCDKGTLIL